MRSFWSFFWLSPCIAGTVLALSFTAALTLFHNDLRAFTADEGPLDITTYFCYAALLAALFRFRGDFTAAAEKHFFYIFCFFAVSALLREAGIQHWLASKDTTAFKLRFFTNDANPFYEKALSIVCLLTVFILFVYTMTVYLAPAVRGFFKKMPGSWTVISLLSAGALSKIADRLPANLRKEGIFLDKQGTIFGLIETFEETMELLLPILAVVALIQFHIGKIKNTSLFYPSARHKGAQ